MLRKLKLVIILVVLATSITGCTVESDRIYTICKIDDGEVYCYKNENEFYKVLEDNTLLKLSGVGLYARPMLQIIPSEGEYEFYYQLPGLYKGTLESVHHYVYKLQEDGCGKEDIVYSDCNILDMYLYNNEYSVRIVYNIRGDIRIYAIDSSDNPIKPPYLNDKDI